MMRTLSRMFTTLAATGLVLGLMFSGARANTKAADATGTWKWTVTTQNGQTFEPVLKLKQEGEKLTGTISGRNNNDIEIKDGKVKDGEVSFKVVRERNGQTFTQEYKGKLEGDTIKGKIEFERNGEKQSRDWEAKRS